MVFALFDFLSVGNSNTMGNCFATHQKVPSPPPLLDWISNDEEIELVFGCKSERVDISDNDDCHFYIVRWPGAGHVDNCLSGFSVLSDGEHGSICKLQFNHNYEMVQPANPSKWFFVGTNKDEIRKWMIYQQFYDRHTSLCLSSHFYNRVMMSTIEWKRLFFGCKFIEYQ